MAQVLIPPAVGTAGFAAPILLLRVVPDYLIAFLLAVSGLGVIPEPTGGGGGAPSGGGGLPLLTLAQFQALPPEVLGIAVEWMAVPVVGVVIDRDCPPSVAGISKHSDTIMPSVVSIKRGS